MLSGITKWILPQEKLTESYVKQMKGLCNLYLNGKINCFKFKRRLKQLWEKGNKYIEDDFPFHRSLKGKVDFYFLEIIALLNEEFCYFEQSRLKNIIIKNLAIIERVESITDDTCPYCGSNDVKAIIWGYVVNRKPLTKQEEEKFDKNYILGGCVVEEDSPNYHCCNCNKGFR